MIRLEAVTKSYHGRSALRGITTAVERSEFVFLTGPSGAGKSTLLRLLYRAELPDDGSILVNGRDLATLKGSQVAEFRRTLGVIFQDFKLLRRRTVGENISFVLSLLDLSEREQQRRAYLALREMGLANRLHAYPDELSGGEQQRVAIARALVSRPPVLFADEPTGNLDSRTSREVLQMFQRLNQEEGITIVLVTHEVANRRL